MQEVISPIKDSQKTKFRYRNNIDRNEWVYYINYFKKMINKFTMKKRRKVAKKRKRRKVPKDKDSGLPKNIFQV
ncbi:MAG: hypothetical protein CM15mV87_300 [Caudoviricetes sp.]|nr:MAG: hypothetical protein CM15mV87_300 [Caudoviricetes sp.]